MLTLGEVHTGLLQHATALPQAQVSRMLNLREGDPVLRSGRPSAYAVSPDILTGVDCRLPSNSGKQIRGAGTVVSRAIITGGRILQGSSHTRVTGSRENRRLPWSHYLSQPGQVEAVGRVDWSDVQTGFISGKAWPNSLNIGAVSARAMDTVQQNSQLDRRPPFRAQRTCLRWVVSTASETEAPPRAAGRFTVQSDTLRTLELRVAPGDLRDAIGLCEDLALHDWLLSTMVTLLEITLTSTRPVTEKISRLRPAIEHLLHLWMPGARVSDEVLPVWTDIERRPGFTRQWDASVNWIRDQISIGTMTLLQALVSGDPTAANRT
jgi:hypothetical protein